jgi:hypothetical protein
MARSALLHPTLVLNRNWQPIHIATVARALVLLWNETARVVDPDDFQLYTWADWSKLAPRGDEPFIQAVRFTLRAPEVIVLSDYERVPVATVTFNRRNVFKRDHNTCQYCGAQPGSEELLVSQVYRKARQSSKLQDEVRFLGGALINIRIVQAKSNQTYLGKCPVRPGLTSPNFVFSEII